MVRPANARVWNEDLVAALEARAEFARQQGKQRHHLWSEGARAIQAVRQDIYAFKTGRIVGLPETKLKKTVAELCRKIIQGSEPILPSGFTPADLTQARSNGRDNGNILTRDHYLNNIKIRGGAFAILMAFYTRGFPVMTQDQVCDAAQPFCDEPMQANYMQGRPHGAWSAHKTLQSHQLLLQQKPQVQYTSLRGGGHGFRTAYGARASYSLTEKGKLFVTTLLEHRPEAKQELLSHGGGGPRVLGGAGNHAGLASMPFGASSVGGVRSTVLSSPAFSMTSTLSATRGDDDEEELRNWARTASIGESKTFNISKARRRDLHDVCDELSRSFLLAKGRRLHHSSRGTGRNRTLVVTMESTGALGGVTSVNVDRFSMYNEFDDEFTATPQLHASSSHGTPPKRARTANEAAAEAAMLRAALHESAMMAKQQQSTKTMAPKQLYVELEPSASTSKQSQPTLPTKPIVLDDSIDSDDDDVLRHVSALSRRATTAKTTPPTVLELSDSSDDDGDARYGKKPAAKPKKLSIVESSVPQEDNNGVIDLTEEDAAPSRQSKRSDLTTQARQLPHSLTILIDNRERNRNATPRQLRMELNRILSNGLLRRVWPSSLPSAVVEERQLARGDFAFQTTFQNTTSVIPVAIERKTIGDIVQRSVNQDHWKQLCQMRDGFDMSFFLLEGDMRTAVQHTAYGAQDHDDAFSPTSYKIEDFEGLVRFIGRAVVTTPSFRLIQSDHEQGSLRAVASFALMSLYHYAFGETLAKSEVTKLQSQASAKQQLKDRLQNGGIPWQLAKCVADEVGSTKQMDRIYGSADDGDCRDLLFATLIGGLCSQLTPLKGSPEQWSTAIHRVYYSPLPDIDVGRKAFEDYKGIASDDASLLANIHSGMSAPDALDKTLSDCASRLELPRLVRAVHIELPSCIDLEHIFLDEADNTSPSIWKIKTISEVGMPIPSASMATTAGHFCSSRLCIFFLEGGDLLQRILNEFADREIDFVGLAQAAAKKIHTECAKSSAVDRRLLLLRGLPNALGQAAKKSGYRSELPVLVDMVLAQLSLAHELVVIQAMRLQEDREMILLQLALSCYYFQPLLHKSSRN